MRAIQSARMSPLRCLRSRNAYASECMTASLADLYSRLRVPCIPSASSSTFLCRARAVTPRLTLAIARLLQVWRQTDHRPAVGRRRLVLLAVLALPLGALVLQQVRA